MPRISNENSAVHDVVPVVFRNKMAPIKNVSGGGGRSGTKTMVESKSATDRKNGAQTGTSQKLAKLDSETCSQKLPTVSGNFKKALVQARLSKKWNQKELAQQVHVKPHDIVAFEQGKLRPSGNVHNKLCRVLGVQLPSSVQK